MGSNASIQLQKDELDDISAQTGFSVNQVKRLYCRFTSLDKNHNGYLRREDLSCIPELHVNPLGERIIQILIDDEGTNGQLNFLQFVKVLATFRRSKESNDKQSKLKFLFKVYDRDGDNKINKKEMEDVLHMMVGNNIPDDQIVAIAERTIKELDANGDMSITFSEFCKTLEKIDIDEKMSIKFLA